MHTIRRLLSWSWRAWPVWVLLAVITIHLMLIYYFCMNATATNKAISLFAQLIGGLLILYSIDSNIGIIKEKSLLAIFANYLREFPLIKRSIVIELQVASMSMSAGKVKLTVGRNPKSIEEKIEYLQEQINEVKRDVEQESKELNEKIDRQSTGMNTKIQEAQSALQKVESKMGEVSIGGTMVQLFGILLMIYGAMAGYLA